ncbi:L,D-transpeptidase family protein [Streptomyces niveus]|uniref:L,D-transpeptidase family protein n=1 Tax=Streptomyces niveus TaxID=193462 RepID=UPI00367B325D
MTGRTGGSRTPSRSSTTRCTPRRAPTSRSPVRRTWQRAPDQLPDPVSQSLVVNFNRWPAVPGRGAGIFLHVNGSGATAGCVSVPRPTMDRITGWITPAAHPRITIG